MIKFQNYLPPEPRVLLKLYIFKVSQVVEHLKVDDFYFIVIEIEVLQIGKHCEYHIIDHRDIVERHV